MSTVYARARGHPRSADGWHDYSRQGFPMANPAPLPPGNPQGFVSRSTIFPLRGDRSGLVAKTHIIPIVATIRAEVVKALPIFALALLAARSSDPLARCIGVTEPLDGILIGVASGGAFALVETVGLYVPVAMNDVLNKAIQAAVQDLGPQVGPVI